MIPVIPCTTCKALCMHVNVILCRVWFAQGLINVFQVTSTWLTVNVALGRYVAICHPLHARGYIRPRGTRIAVGAIIIASALFNAPRFAKYTVMRTACDELLGSPSSAVATAENITLEVDTMVTGVSMTSQSLTARTPVDCSCYYYWKVSIFSQQHDALRPAWLIAKCFCGSVHFSESIDACF